LYMRLLVIMPDVPYPPRENGFTIRYYPIIDYLSLRHDVDLVSITVRSGIEDEIEYMRRRLNRLCIIDQSSKCVQSPWRKIFTRVRSWFPWSAPLEFVHYEADEHISRIKAFAGNVGYDAVIWVTSSHADYIRRLKPAIKSKRWVIDFVDSPSLFSSRKRGGILLRYEKWHTLLWEAGLVRAADVPVYISPVDARTVPRALTGGKVPHVIPNGIYVDDYVEDRLDSVSPLSIGFLGNMGYQPNIQAALKLYEQIYLPLRKKLPELELYIIGRSPAEEVKALGKEKFIHVTGTVANIWPYVNSVSIFVLPLDAGAGQQNKILEVMYAGRPVIASRISNGGIGAVHGQQILVCGENSAEWITSAYELLTEREKAERLGQAGRRFAIRQYVWPAICSEYESLFSDNRVASPQKLKTVSPVQERRNP
ncbi:MAG TPA: glycosyltransferase family 4 protein, partial [Gammaproteobacteria bacterium]